MSSIEIKRKDHTKHGTSSISINNAVFSLKECEILEIVKTKYG